MSFIYTPIRATSVKRSIDAFIAKGGLLIVSTAWMDCRGALDIWCKFEGTRRSQSRM